MPKESFIKKGEFIIRLFNLSSLNFGGVLKSMLTLNEAIIDVKEG